MMATAGHCWGLRCPINVRSEVRRMEESEWSEEERRCEEERLQESRRRTQTSSATDNCQARLNESVTRRKLSRRQ